jgi:hypothetical protein
MWNKMKIALPPTQFIIKGKERYNFSYFNNIGTEPISINDPERLKTNLNNTGNAIFWLNVFTADVPSLFIENLNMIYITVIKTKYHTDLLYLTKGRLRWTSINTFYNKKYNLLKRTSGWSIQVSFGTNNPQPQHC